MLKKIENAADPFDALCEAEQLSKPGCDWLKRAVDPFHDYELPSFQGYPDATTEPTVIYTINQQATITAPTTAATDGLPWDANIAVLPVDYCPFASACYYNPRVGETGNPAGLVITDAATNYAKAVPEFGCLTAWTTRSGEPTFIPWKTQAFINSDVHHLGLEDYISTTKPSRYRIIAGGFEVVNTTAALHKQGDVTVYTTDGRGDGTSVTSWTGNYAGAYSYGATPPNTTDLLVAGGSAQVFKSPPVNIAQAKQTTGARTWQAADGAYVPVRIRTPNGYSTIGKHDWVMTSGSVGVSSLADDIPVDFCLTGLGTNRQIRSFVELEGAILGQTTYPELRYQGDCHLSDIDISGAYFTGLSPDTTLTVSLRLVIELIPPPSDPERFSLAKAPASLDCNALMLYYELLRVLPPGVPVGYNEAGKWFRMVKSAARGAIGSAIPYLPALEAALLSMGRPASAALVSAVAAAAKPLTNKTKAQDKKRSVKNFGKP
jgi:hypothetical protein